RLARFTKMVRNSRQRFDDRLLVRCFRVQHTQRIRLDTPLTIRAELILHVQQFRAQHLDIFRPALLPTPRAQKTRTASQLIPRRSPARPTAPALPRQSDKTADTAPSAAARAGTSAPCNKVSRRPAVCAFRVRCTRAPRLPSPPAAMKSKPHRGP